MPGKKTHSVKLKPASAISAIAMRARNVSDEPRINVSGIRLHRQRVEPAPHLIRLDPMRVLELLTLAKHRVEPLVAKLDAPRDAGLRDIALDQREFERE